MLKTAKKKTSSTVSKFWYDAEAAERAVRFFPAMLTHVKGELGGKPFEPQEWEKDQIIRPIFGWKREDGTRKYRTVFVFLPRKNNKTTLITGLGLYMLCGEDEPGAEIYNAAADKDQARISFDIAKKMISNNDILSKGLETYRDTIVRQKTWGKYKVISSDADTKHGYNSHCVIIDELHAFKNRDLYDVLMTSTGARRQPLVLIITTAGFDRKSICYQIYNYAKKVRDGLVKDDSFLPVIFEADENDDPFDPKTWAKANPGYDVTIKKEYLETEANKALVNPSDLNVFKRLHLNIWTKSETVWIPSHTWNGDKSKQIKRELEYYKDRQCFIGIDLANYADLLPVCMVFPNDDGTFDVLIEYWVTEDKANDRKSKNEADYLTWAGQGYVHLTPGNVADYQTIRKRIGEIAQIVKIQVIGYDDWNASQFAQDLGSDGANINPWSPNNFKLWHKPSQTLEALATAGKINHMNNPVLAWNIENVVIRYNGEYIKPDKSKSKDKIDGVIALIIAIGEWMNYINQPAPTNGGIGL